MPSIVIRLEPAKLDNPDADLRYEIPDLLEARSEGLLRNDGYDYEPTGNAMQIYLITTDVGSGVAAVVAFLEQENLLGNSLAVAAQVGVSEDDPADATECQVVYPAGASGVIVPPP